MTTTTGTAPRLSRTHRRRTPVVVAGPTAPLRRRRAAAPKRVNSLPFLGAVAALLGAALFALLLINNSLAAGSFDQAQLKGQQILLGEREQALRQSVERLSSPTRLREAAKDAGMVAAATTAYLDLATGEILGVPLPAGDTTLAVDPTTGIAVDPTTGLAVEPLLDPTTGLPVDPAATDPAVTDPAVTDPAVTDPAVTDPAATDPAVTDPAADAADGAAVPPAGTTAYDRAIVSGGGR